MLVEVIVDTSGSMAEMGKIHLQWNLCRFIRELDTINPIFQSDADFRIFQWNSKIGELELEANGDITTTVPVGASDLVVLSSMLETHLVKNHRLNVLILSDGYFNSSMLNHFNRWLKDHPDISIRTVAIGADANLHSLKHLSTNNDVYFPEDIPAAIESMVYDFGSSTLPPTDLEHILSSGSKAGLKD
ncbi:VWA domain-containing protein [bacterium]|nr:VWA domain-containing protein [bacterium]